MCLTFAHVTSENSSLIRLVNLGGCHNTDRLCTYLHLVRWNYTFYHGLVFTLQKRNSKKKILDSWQYFVLPRFVQSDPWCGTGLSELMTQVTSWLGVCHGCVVRVMTRLPGVSDTCSRVVNTRSIVGSGCESFSRGQMYFRGWGLLMGSIPGSVHWWGEIWWKSFGSVMPWCTCTGAVNSLHNCTCSARAVQVHFFLKKNFKKRFFFN